MSKAVRSKRIKVSSNLFKIGEVYYWRRGDDEKALGTFRTDAAAIKAKDAHEATRGLIGAQAYRVRLKHVFPEYLQNREDQKDGKIKGRRAISSGTFKEITTIWDLHLVEFFGNKFFADIDDLLWEKYCEQATVGDLKNHRKVFGGFLRWAKKKGLIRVLPEFDIPHVVPRKRPILTQDQITALIENAASSNALLFISMYLFMGMRRGEQMHLKWSDIDFKRRSLIVRDETTRTRKGRPVPINDFVLNLLSDRISEQQASRVKTPYVFPKRGDPSRHMLNDGISSTWHTTLQRSGLEGLVEPHDLRATFEYFANKRSEFTDMQREKMAGASIKIQSKRYVSFEADDVRGLEQSVRFDGLEESLNSTRIHRSSRKPHGKKTGKAPKKSGVDIEKGHE